MKVCSCQHPVFAWAGSGGCQDWHAQALGLGTVLRRGPLALSNSLVAKMHLSGKRTMFLAIYAAPVKTLHPSPECSFLLLGVSAMKCWKPEELALHWAEFSMLRERAELLAIKHIGNDLIKIGVPGKATEVHCLTDTF